MYELCCIALHFHRRLYGEQISLFCFGGLFPPKLVFGQMKFTIQFALWPYKGLYWHISVKDLEQEQTVKGRQDFWFFRVLFVACISVLCSKMFVRLQAEICSDVCGFDCERSHSAAGEYTENDQSKHCPWQFFSRFAFFKQKVSQSAACDSKKLLSEKALKTEFF